MLFSVCAGLAVCNHTLNVLAFFLVDWMLFPDMITTLAQHYLVVPWYFSARPCPFHSERRASARE